MQNKIISITEKLPVATTLPDGLYQGIWGGCIIELTVKNKNYELITEEGVRGGNFKVIVEIANGIATFSEINS